MTLVQNHLPLSNGNDLTNMQTNLYYRQWKIAVRKSEINV